MRLSPLFAAPARMLCALALLVTAVLVAWSAYAQTGSVDAAITQLVAAPNSYMGWVTLAIAIASVLCASTTTPAKGTAFGAAYELLELIAGNIGRAKQLAPNALPVPTVAAAGQIAATVAMFFIALNLAVSSCDAVQQDISALAAADPALASQIKAQVAKVDALLLTAQADIAADVTKAKPVIAEVCTFVKISAPVFSIGEMLLAISPPTQALVAADTALVAKACSDIDDSDTSTIAGDFAVAVKAYSDIRGALADAGAVPAAAAPAPATAPPAAATPAATPS